METVASKAPSVADMPLAEMVAELTSHQGSINALRARQLELVAAIVRTETVEDDDGMLIHLPMADVHRRLDAAALVAGALGVSQQSAQGWVDRAEQLAGPLTLVREAMADGTLDEARMKVITDELIDASDTTAAVVAEQLMPQIRDGLAEDPSSEAGVRLQRRVRAVLAGVDPDAVRDRAAKARSERFLRRWAAEAGVESWFARLPADQSLKAWGAVDELARQFITEGRSPDLDTARLDALISLIEGQSTVTYTVQLGIPTPDTLTPDDAEMQDPATPDPEPEPGGRTGVTPAEPAETTAAAETAAAQPVSQPASGRDVRAHSAPSSSDLVAAALAALAAHGDSDVQVTGGGNSQATDVRADWVADALAEATAAGRVRVVHVHPNTGALIDPDDDLATTAYVPGKELAALVKARDGRCRFPGCTVNARFTDLDHVRPWPDGPTSALNLMCLCRRHHRIKQLIGWRVRLRPDATVLWVDPLGQRRLTRPLDHRGRQQRPPATAPPEGRDQSTGPDDAQREREIERALAREPVFSVLEHIYEHTLLRTGPRTRLGRANHRRLHQTGNLPDHRHFPYGLVPAFLAVAEHTGWRLELDHDGPAVTRRVNHPRWGEAAKYDKPPF